MFVEDKLEASGQLKQLLQKVHRLLNVGLAGPASPLPHRFRQPQDDTRLFKRIHRI